MFAIIKAGGKQYKVSKDDKIKVEKIDAAEGDTVACEVLFGEGGKGLKVNAKVWKHVRNDKIIVFKKKRRQNYRRKAGHRQHQTILEIIGVDAA